MKIFYILFILFQLIVCPIYAQLSKLNDLHKGFSLGIEKNSMGVINYGISDYLYFHLKHSLLADALKTQYIQLSSTIDFEKKNTKLQLMPFISFDYDASYFNYGCDFSLIQDFHVNETKIGVSFIPYYDTILKYSSGWAISGQTEIINDISFFVEYTRRPEYRIADKKMYLGFSFYSGKLIVKPMLKTPIYDSGIRLDHSQVILNFNYLFK